MNILSIDVAVTKPTAYALYRDDKLSCYDKVSGIPEIEEFITECQDITTACRDIDLILAEDMYCGVNFLTIKKLCYEIGKLIYVADKHKIEYRLIRPVDWMSHHGLTNKNPEYVKDIQKLIIWNETDVKTDDDDVQAAILIGLYVIERVRMGYDD